MRGRSSSREPSSTVAFNSRISSARKLAKDSVLSFDRAPLARPRYRKCGNTGNEKLHAQLSLSANNPSKSNVSRFGHRASVFSKSAKSESFAVMYSFRKCDNSRGARTKNSDSSLRSSNGNEKYKSSVYKQPRNRTTL